MVKTRTEGETGAKPSSSKTIDDEDYDYEAESGYEPGSADEETPSKKKRKARSSNAKPAGKRQKTAGSPSKEATTNGKGPAVKGGRRRKTLSLLPNMPLDILFEIFKHLSPKDLINLSRTSVAFEKTMSDPKTSTVWMAARKAFDAPDPAQGFTEARWGELLFDNTCEWCGKKNVQDVDWNNLKRTCSSCKNEHLLGAKDRGYRKTFAGCPSELFDCLPNTNIRPWTRETYDPDYNLRKLYWVPDVHEMAEEWKARSAKAQSSPESREAFDTWKEERKATVKANAAMTHTYKDWFNNRIRQLGDDKYENTKKRLEAAKQRLLNEGHSQVDIDHSIYVFTPGIKTGGPTISNGAWTKIRSRLEPLVEQEKNRRLAREMQSVIAQRMIVLKGVYNRHLAQRTPSESYLCPPVEFLRPLDSVMEILEADRDLTITEESFDPIIPNLDQYIAKYQTDKRKAILNTIPQHLRPENPEDAFNLARFVFRCELGRPPNRYGSGATHENLIGWTMVAGEPCIKLQALQLRPGVFVNRPCQFDYSDRSSAISCTLISLAGLDPNTTTIAEMDTRDPRFALLKTWFDDSWVDTYQVFTWRAALYYVSRRHEPQQPWSPPQFRLATAEEMETARRRTATVHETVKAWSCNHCHEFFENAKTETKAVIIQHLKDRHDISDPKPLVDFIRNPQMWPLFEAACEVPLQVSSPECFRCERCQPVSLNRYDMNGIRNHLQNQHHTSNPRPGYWNEFTVDQEMIVGLK